jgi:5-methylcytosine-specific restriction protein A
MTSSSAGRKIRPPAWSRDELILALDLYFTLGPIKARQHHPKVIELSGLLRKINNIPEDGDPSFRSGNSVHLKLQNFLRVDPSYNGTGMSSGNQMERDVWEEFANNRSALAKAATAIRLNSKAH